jgi:hypothetical protein
VTPVRLPPPSSQTPPSSPAGQEWGYLANGKTRFPQGFKPFKHESPNSVNVRVQQYMLQPKRSPLATGETLPPAHSREILPTKTQISTSPNFTPVLVKHKRKEQQQPKQQQQPSRVMSRKQQLPGHLTDFVVKDLPGRRGAPAEAAAAPAAAAKLVVPRKGKKTAAASAAAAKLVVPRKGKKNAAPEFSLPPATAKSLTAKRALAAEVAENLLAAALVNQKKQETVGDRAAKKRAAAAVKSAQKLVAKTAVVAATVMPTIKEQIEPAFDHSAHEDMSVWDEAPPGEKIFTRRVALDSPSAANLTPFSQLTEDYASPVKTKSAVRRQSFVVKHK